VEWNGGGAHGSWRISGDKFCTKYRGVRGGNETCLALYKTGDNEYQAFLPDGGLDGTFSYTN
jgi:hypothetical protein